MKQEVCILPVRCSGCNTVFDLWHVLQEQESSKKSIADKYEISKIVKQSLCPNCRAAILQEFEEEEFEQDNKGWYEILFDFDNE